MNKDQAIPMLREDIAFHQGEENGITYITLFDPHGYADMPVSMPMELMALFNVIDGKITYNDLFRLMEFTAETEDEFKPIAELLEYLDYMGYMESGNLALRKADIENYKMSPVRPPICAGEVYSDDRDELNRELDEIMALADTGYNHGLRGLIVPHIDFRNGPTALRTYSAAYNALKVVDADLYVVIGTSHSVNSNRFMLTKKDFQTPLGILETDKKLIDLLLEDAPASAIIDDMAHRSEFTIELQALLISKIVNGRKVKILPVLAGSFFDYLESGARPGSDSSYMSFISKLNEAIEKLGRKAVYIASVDLAHIGRKFGDDFDADTELDTIRDEDSQLIEYIKKGDPDGFFESIASVDDKRRICGFAPIYATMQLAGRSKGHLLHYDQWDETETKSAVTFASLAIE